MQITSELVTRCALCGDARLGPLALTLRPGAPHFCRVRCRGCGLVISSPMASRQTLDAYYAHYYATGHHADHTREEDCEARLEATLAQLGEVQRHARSGRFLDVGCGAGFVCKAAEKLGFEAHGVDLSQSGIDFGRSRWGLQNLRLGELSDCRYPDGHFEVVHCWHVIEHVRDPVALVREIRRVLAPGGVLCWGTDNHRSLGYVLLRALCALALRFPPIYDGIDHTFGFDPSTITRLLENEGFSSLRLATYSDGFSAGEILRDARADGPAKAARTLAQMIFHIKMKGIARKREAG